MSDVLHPWIWAERCPERPALVIFDTGAVLTFKQMMDGANRYARLFERLGLVVGDKVAVLMENQPAFPQLCWAAENSGLYLVPIAKQLNANDAAYIIENSEAQVLVTSRALAPLATELAARLPAGVKLLMCDGAIAPYTSAEEALAAEEPSRLLGRPRGDILFYSSGTTGRPKGIRRELSGEPPEVPVMTTHRMWTDIYGLRSDSVVLASGPLYHSMPLRSMTHAHREGATVITQQKFDAAEAVEAIERHRVTIASMVPTMFNRILKLPPELLRKERFQSLRAVVHTGAPCPVPIKEQMIDLLGPIVHEVYGGSEGIGNTTITATEWLAHKGSVGRPVQGTKVRVIGEDGKPCPAGVPGLIYMSNGRTFEYLNDPAKTADSRNVEGWSNIGDIGYLDEDGYLYLTDRQSNMIISGGVNIYPQEAENVLATCPLVADVAVIGVPNEDFGEEVKAIVVPAEPIPLGQEVSVANQIVDYCRAHLSTLKCPRTVDFVDVLPRNEAGKIVKHELRKKYWPAATSQIAAGAMDARK